jgi:nucleotide-binding universal stress UspA family protein
MMETVIAAVSGTPSERVLTAAADLAERFLARIVVVHVNQHMAPGIRGGRYPLNVDEDERQARIRAEVEGLRSAGADVELEIVSSRANPSTAIADAARRHGAGAIVVASDGHAPLVGALGGSVAQRLIHEAPCPVIALTPETRPTAFRLVPRAAVAAA